MLPPALVPLTTFLREFNELQLGALRRLCCDDARAHPLLRDLVVRFVDDEQHRRYRGVCPDAQPGVEAGLLAAPAASAAADAERIAQAVPLLRSPEQLTCAELLPIGVFLELLGARLSDCAQRQAVATA